MALIPRWLMQWVIRLFWVLGVLLMVGALQAATCSAQRRLDWFGFLASEEANIFDFQKEAIVEATEEGTSVSRTVTGKPARIIKSKWTEHWVKEEVDPLPMPFQGQISGPVMAAANRDGRGDINPGFAGQEWHD